MQERTVDVAIIGAGTAGLNARKEVEKAGKSWVLIESGPYGTTCARVGCMPSKLLIAAAEAAHDVAGASRFGVRVDPASVQIDGEAVMERVRRERDRFVGFVVRDTMKLEHRIEGRARFTGPNTLEVDDHTRVRFTAAVVATGSSPWIPPPLGEIPDRVIVNDDVFDWTDLPDSVAVFGTGIIGLELAQALHRLGVRVSLFNPFADVGPFSDPQIKATARRILCHELDLNLEASIKAVRDLGDAAEITWNTPGGVERTERFDTVLAAAGRRPNLGGLGLENAGIELDERGRPTTEVHTAQVGDSPIFLAGDVAGHRPLLHEASDEGRIAGANAARFPDVTYHPRRVSLAVAFTAPQMGMVGERYADLDPSKIVVGEVSYADQGRARVMGINQGLVRIYARKSDCRVVGAEMFGPRVEHTAHLLAWVVQSGLNVTTALSMPFYHPVIEEGIRTALRDAAEKLRITGLCQPADCSESAGM